MAIKVIGHKVPDTDATTSAITFAWFLNEVLKVEAAPYVAGKPNREAMYVLDRFNVHTPDMLTSVSEDDDIAIVDTNNPEELIEGIDKANILYIFDHHKLAGLTTSAPLRINIRPLASTNTIIYLEAKEMGASLPKDIAGLMLSGILSDTLEFRSITTTDIDKKVALELSEKLGIDTHDLATEMFAAKSYIGDMSVRDILLADHKNYTLGGKSYKVAVFETTDPGQVLEKKNELIAEIDTVRKEESIENVLFFVIDILNTNAYLIISDTEVEDIANRVFGKNVTDKVMELPGVASRKKQIVPPLEKVLG
jgi:manganese-dependent inorganic pyrophosphatase